MSEEKIQRLQALEQSLHSYEVQKSSLRGALVEAESALTQIQSTTETYRIVGNIMVKADKETLTKELTEKINVLKSRVETVEKQEKRLREEAKSLQEEIMQTMGEKHE